MKNFITLMILLTLASCKKEEFNPELTREFSIHSTTNGADYKIKVALPENYNAAEKYAAVYVLDGEDNFNYVAEQCKNYSGDFGKSNILVVSIGYGNDRKMDYTPTKAEEGDGGAEKFMQFIISDLIPKMENEFNADTLRKNRIILGHSFGGLFVAYAFTNHNNVFGNYIMLSPSIWYDNEVMLKLEQENRNAIQNNDQLVFMGLGELENSGRMLAPYAAFYNRLKNNYSNILLESQIVNHLDHNGSKNTNISKGLKFYFRNK